MDILELNFKILNYCGLWWPEESKSSKKSLYSVLTIFTTTIIYMFTIMQLLDMILGDYNIDEISNNIFTLFTMMSLCFKITNFLIRRKSTIALLETLRQDICRHHNYHEENIRKQFDALARSNTIWFAGLSDVTIFAFFISPLVTDSYKQRILPFKAWLPYSLSNIWVYWTMYIYQLITMVIAANLNVVNDTLVSGLIVQACAQLEILKYRILNILNHQLVSKHSDDINEHRVESNVKLCIQHHVLIYKFAASVESVFSWVIFFQFFVSILTLCSSVFKLSQDTAAGMEIASCVCYVGCMLLQLLFYCWHGNEVKLKSLSLSDAVFGTEWTRFTPQIKKSLSLIMTRSRMPIIITCGSMLPLSLETFTMVLKASYSAFNLLQKA